MVELSWAVVNSLRVAGNSSLVLQPYHRHPERFWNMSEWLIHSAQSTQKTDPPWVCMGKREKASNLLTWIHDSTSSRRRVVGKGNLGRDKRPQCWQLTPWPGSWCGLVTTQRKSFSRMLSKEHPWHSWRGRSGDRDRQKDGDTLFFFSYFCLSLVYIDCSSPLLVIEHLEYLYVLTTAWPCCHLAKLHTSRSFHLSLWTTLSSLFNHFGSSFLNSIQFKNKLNSPLLWI